MRPEIGPVPESVFLGEYELGVAEQEPPGGPVTQHLGRPVPGGRIPGLVGAQQVLGLLAVVLQVRVSRQPKVALDIATSSGAEVRCGRRGCSRRFPWSDLASPSRVQQIRFAITC